jgi:hypothetical protein
MMRPAYECPGSKGPARWIPHPVAKGIDIPICPVCGRNGFRAVERGLVPHHVTERQKRDYSAEWQRTKEKREVKERS